MMPEYDKAEIVGNPSAVCPVTPPWHGPLRLWSLWDMFEHEAGAFYEVTRSLQRLRALLRVNAPPIHDPAFSNLKHEIDAELRRMFPFMKPLGTKVTVHALIDLMVIVGRSGVSLDAIGAGLDDFSTTLSRELKGKKVLVLDAREQAYFEPMEPLFGPEVAANFPTDGAFEIDEAAKCLAFARPTAGVFHLMRTMEIGIRAVARCLQIADPLKPADRNWGAILKLIKEALDKRWPTGADRMHGDGSTFENIYASLDAVKNPWRNATMHVEKKYTDDEAEHIFVAVKGFMKKLASRCDEAGNPQA